MAKQTTIKADLSQLEDMLKKLGGEYVCRVGLIGSKGSEQHEGTELTNATVGLYNEFGTENIPVRSFLRLPLETKQRDIVQGMAKGKAQEAIKEGDIKRFYEIMGLKAVEIIQEAFSTQGYGNWPPNAPSTIKQKGSSSPLINTSQLRRSVDFDVVKKSELR